MWHRPPRSTGFGGSSADGAAVDFEQFVLQHGRELVAFARRLTMDFHDGEDVVQEALARCARRWARKAVDNPRAYAYRAVINEVHSRRRRHVVRELPAHELEDEVAIDDVGYQAVDDRTGIAAALRRLPAHQRTVLVLRYYNDMTEHMIRDVTGWPLSTIRSHARRGLRRLEQQLREASPSAGAEL